MVNYSTTTLTKQGTLVDGNVTYNVNVTAVNNELARLNVVIHKKVTRQYPDANGGFMENQEDTYIGSITLEHGRKVIEIIQDENPIPHITMFQEIMDEVLGKKPVEG